MEDTDEITVSGSSSTTPTPIPNKQYGAPIVFLREDALFEGRKPHYSEYLKHEEMFKSISNRIDKTHITGLQRVNGLWRIYLDNNLEDKAKLITEGVHLRGRTLPILQTNPFRLDSENTTRIRVQDIPLSADDGQITRALILKGVDVISCTREKLRIDQKLTNCETGDRLLIVKTLSLKEPLNRFMYIGKYKAKIIHRGQNKTKLNPKCPKCLTVGHTIDACENDWTCIVCKTPGHKKDDCPSLAPASSEETESVQEPPPTDMSADDTSEETPSPATNETHENTSSTPVSPRSRRTAKASKTTVAKGQTSIDRFMKDTGTPDKTHRSRSVSQRRGPTTPPERLHELTKKSRPDDHGSGRSHDD